MSSKYWLGLGGRFASSRAVHDIKRDEEYAGSAKPTSPVDLGAASDLSLRRHRAGGQLRGENRIGLRDYGMSRAGVRFG